MSIEGVAGLSGVCVCGSHRIGRQTYRGGQWFVECGKCGPEGREVDRRQRDVEQAIEAVSRLNCAFCANCA